jgi:hypothetical protein
MEMKEDSGEGRILAKRLCEVGEIPISYAHILIYSTISNIVKKLKLKLHRKAEPAGALHLKG